MTKVKYVIPLIILLVLFVWMRQGPDISESPPPKKFKLIRILPEGWSNSSVSALNESGQVLLDRRVGDQQWETYLWRGPGDLEQIGAETGKSLSGWDLNDYGEALVSELVKPGESRDKKYYPTVQTPYFWSEDFGLVLLERNDWMADLTDEGRLTPGFINNQRQIVIRRSNGRAVGFGDSFLFRADFDRSPDSTKLGEDLRVEKFAGRIIDLNENGSVLINISGMKHIVQLKRDYPLQAKIEGDWLREDTFLNDRDEVIGFCSKRDPPTKNPANRHGFYSWSAARGFRMIESLDHRLAWHIHASGANNNGCLLLVDSSGRPKTDPLGPGRQVYLWNGKEVIDLKQFFDHDPGWSFDGFMYSPKEINDKGQIAGTADYNGESCAFLLTPIEE